MPEISAFYGIRIYIQFSDHPPPHVHAYYGDHEAKVAIHDGSIIAGSLPPLARRRVRRWVGLHRAELADAWDRVMHHEAPGRIEPLH
jgi:hypothetical protein